jgi:uroporphyrinogen decarboxylase
MQSSRQVIDALMRNRQCERVGFHDSLWGQTVATWTRQGYPVDDRGVPIPVEQHFGFDMEMAFAWFPWDARVNVSDTLEETAEWRIVRNGSGAAFKWWKGKDGVPEHIDFHMTSRAIWEQEYKPHVVGSARRRITDESIAAAKAGLHKAAERNRWSFFGNLFVWEGMRQSFGDLCLYEAMLVDPEWIHDYCRTYTDLYKECYAILFAEAGRPDGIWVYEDMGFKNSLFCSPDMFADRIFPYFAEICAFFHDHDLPVVLHTCGLAEPLLEMIIDAGFDGLNPMEVKAGNDPLRIAETVAGRIALVGGLDARVLESGDRALIRSSVTDLVDGMKARGARHVFGSDHSVSINVPFADYVYATEVYRERMGY